MPKLVHTMPFMILRESDIKMAEDCLESLSKSNTDSVLVAYNQGYLTNDELERLLGKFGIKHVVIGDGQNIGIPAARQSCFEYAWANFPEAEYISEIHVDMIFTADWSDLIIDYLENSDEPMLSPGILTVYGELHPEQRGISTIQIPQNTKDILSLLSTLTKDEVCEGLVHPVIHKSKILKDIGGYDTRFLKGKQGYEDDSILLGYRYHMGIRSDWKPKAYLKSRVYHISLAQRYLLNNIHGEFEKNLNGLIKQYGIYGLIQLAKIHGNQDFLWIANNRMNQD